MSQSPAHPVFRPGARALITGAASGIGLAAAKFCYAQQMDLVLLDINQDLLSAASKELPSTSARKTSTFQIDVSSAKDWDRVSKEILQLYPEGIDFLMLNAGAGVKPVEGKTVWTDPSYMEKCLAVNVLGYTNGIATFLPTTLKTEKERAIVLTGSKQGITNPPGNPGYNASKSAVKTIAEQLSYELHTTGAKASVHLLVPGWTYTGFGGQNSLIPTKPAGAWTPEQVVERMVQKMGEGVFYILCPDNEVTEDLDRRRIAWSYGDIINERPPLSRWRSDWKEKAAEGIEKMKDA